MFGSSPNQYFLSTLDFSKEKPDGLALFSKLDAELFPRPWSRSKWMELGQSPHYYLGFSGELSNIQAFSLYLHSPHENLAHLLKILVMPKLRGRGESKQRLEQDCLHFKKLGVNKLYLEVEVGNKQAIASYLGFGLEMIHQKKDYYGNGCDAYIMQYLIPK